jgi:two-component system NtrC family sensor kinase
LGLSISYGIIERHGGKIEVQSNVSEGTTFTIKLPLFPQGGDVLTTGNPAQ